MARCTPTRPPTCSWRKSTSSSRWGLRSSSSRPRRCSGSGPAGSGRAQNRPTRVVDMKALGRRPELVALVSVFIGVALVVGKLVVGLLTGSLGIVSEAVHSLLDLAASVFTLFAVRTARKPADTEHPYGHGRAENLAAFAEGVLLLITAAGIAFEAVRRLMLGGAVVNAAGYAFVLLIATLLIEVGR